MLLSSLMQQVRIFIAVSLPEEIHDKLSAVGGQLKKNIGDGVVRWVKSENIHLTLKFLGEIPAGDLALLKTELEKPVGTHAPFSLEVQGVGVFPNLRRPRVIWVGLKESGVLKALFTTVESVTTALGYEPDDRPFSAHLTLGRINQSAGEQQIKHCGEFLASNQVGGLGSFIVKSVDIYRSELNAGGSIYKRLHSIYLR
jgi:2'-5' RNA ligase